MFKPPYTLDGNVCNGLLKSSRIFQNIFMEYIEVVTLQNNLENVKIQNFIKRDCSVI